MRAVRVPDLRLLAGVAVLLAGCSAATQHTFIAPTFDTVVSTTDERQGDPPVHLVFIENHSTVPVVVFNVSLTGCENVKQQCSPHPTNLRVAPGQKQLAIRVEPSSSARGFRYAFGFSWRADSSNANALTVLAAGGDESARMRLAATQRADSLQRTERGPHYNELSRDDFTALAGRASALRAYPDSLLLTPGAKASMDDIRLLVVDSMGTVLGRTRWVRWQVSGNGVAEFLPPNLFVARSPGRAAVRFSLADEAQTRVGRPIADLAYSIVVAYPSEPNAPNYQGVAIDGDSRTPLGCARVALEDSAQNVVASSRTNRAGVFFLNAPRPGTYRVRVETFGWAPVYGPPEVAMSGETKQQQLDVRFVDQLLNPWRGMLQEDFQHASPAAVSMLPYGAPSRGSAAQRTMSVTPVVSGVTLGGSPAVPILGIIGRVPVGRTWVQFVVDSAGRVDTASVQLPRETDKASVASVRSVLPRVRFSPARSAATPTCELLRMQVSFSNRGA